LDKEESASSGDWLGGDAI